MGGGGRGSGRGRRQNGHHGATTMPPQCHHDDVAPGALRCARGVAWRGPCGCGGLTPALAPPHEGPRFSPGHTLSPSGVPPRPRCRLTLATATVFKRVEGNSLGGSLWGFETVRDTVLQGPGFQFAGFGGASGPTLDPLSSDLRTGGGVGVPGECGWI